MTLRTNTLLLAGLLTLSACTTSPTPPTQPQTGASTKAALGVYELSLSGDGKTAKQASVRAQANEVGGLSFQSVQYGYTVDSQSNSTVAYATFDVTNNSGTDITAPTLVPIDTAGTGGTVGYTAFRELKTFGGADASSKAAGLTYTQGTNQQGHTTPLVTSLDSGSITGINTGTTQLAGTARSGWVMARVRAISEHTRGKFRAFDLDITYPAEWGARGIEAKLATVNAWAVDAIENGHNIIVISDRRVNAERVAIPSLLALSSIHHHLVKKGLRMRAGLIVETGDAREVHHFAALAGYGAEAIHPYLALETLVSLHRPVPGLPELAEVTPEKAVANYIKAVGKGLSKIMPTA